MTFTTDTIVVGATVALLALTTGCFGEEASIAVGPDASDHPDASNSVLAAKKSGEAAKNAEEPSRPHTTHVRGGVESAHNAIVQLGGCTGSLISPRLILTAGHCLPSPTAGATGPYNAVIRHFRNGAQSPSILWNGAPLTYWVGQSYSNSLFGNSADPEGDYGIIYNPYGEWPNSDHRNYMRVFKSVDGDFQANLKMWGRGYDNDNGTGGGILRWWNQTNQSCWLNGSNCQKTLQFQATSSQSTCRGDSGGPAIHSPDGKELIAGVASTIEQIYGDNCAMDSPWLGADDITFKRVTDGDMGWIWSQTGMTNGDCPLFNPPGANNAYYRCFTIPYINTYEGEGLDRDVATAIASVIL